jgi:predicted nucleic acid-binding Zn ribbon protein
MSFCGYCGAPRVADARFCGECGGDLDELDRDLAEFNGLYSDPEAVGAAAQADPLPDPPEGGVPSVDAGDGLPCPACGAANQPGDQFCSECGTTLVADEPIDESSAQGSEIPLASVEQVVAVEPQSGLQPDLDSEPDLESELEPEPEPQTFPAHADVPPSAPDDQQAFVPDPPLNALPSQGQQTPIATQVSAPASQAAADDEWVEADPAPAKRGSKALVAAGLLVLASAAGAGAYWQGYIGDRPQAVALQLQANLSGAGYPDVTVNGVPGMTMTLGGFIPDKTDYEVVLQLARNFPGVGYIVSNIKMREPLPDFLPQVNQFIARDMAEPAAFVEEDAGGKLTMRGTVSPAADSRAILAAIKQKFGLQIDNDQTSTGPVPDSQMMADSAPLPNAGAASRSRADPSQRRWVADPRPPRSTGEPAARSPSVDVQTVSCLLPSAEEVRLTLSECRNRNGLVQ